MSAAPHAPAVEIGRHEDAVRTVFLDPDFPGGFARLQRGRLLQVIPLSEGPGVRPGRELVLPLTSAMLAAILRECDVRLAKPPTGSTY